MGLSGRKNKQRIGADPRNLTWADDAAKFGATYLTKLGWDPSQGLGAAGDGRTSHIKVAQKLNMLGIGAGAKQGGKDDVAWKQNREYEMLLKRLNEAEEETAEEGVQVEGSEHAVVTEEARKKRKRTREEKKEDGGKKKRKKEEAESSGKDKKKSKDKKKGASKDEDGFQRDRDIEGDAGPSIPSDSTPIAVLEPEPVISIPTPVARPKAHRARFLRSKQLASRSSSAVAEILGISASASAAASAAVSVFPSPGGSGSATPVPKPDHDLTTASQSVGDYFKARLAAKALGRSGTSKPSGAVVKPPVSLSPAAYEDTPRAGLGSGRGMKSGLELNAFSRAESTPSNAMVKFGGLMGRSAESDVDTTPLGSDAPGGGLAAATESGPRDEVDVAAISTKVKRKKEKREKEKEGREEKEKKKKKERKEGSETMDQGDGRPQEEKKKKKRRKDVD